MTDPIPVNLAFEDELSGVILEEILGQSGRPYFVGNKYSRGGFGYLKRTIRGFNTAARGCPFFVLADLDTYDCPQDLRSDWLAVPMHDNLLFRVAVHEVESWLMADRKRFAQFLGIALAKIPLDLDSVADPKALLINLASQSRSRVIRDDIVPPQGSLRDIGPNYNGRLTGFVRSGWKATNAANHSGSLARALARVSAFVPVFSIGGLHN